MFKELLLKKLIQSKLGNLPKEDQDRILRLVTKHPDLFQEIAMKIKGEIDRGMGQQEAAMKVFGAYQDRLKDVLKEDGKDGIA